MRRKLTTHEIARLEQKLAKYEAMHERARRGDVYTVAEVSLIVRRLVRIRETLANGWTVAARGERLYE